MKTLLFLFVILSIGCNLPNTKPIAGIYNLEVNYVVRDNPVGCATGLAAPMTINITETTDHYWQVSICGPLASDCSHQYLYAQSQDGGYNFNIVSMFAGYFEISYNTSVNGNTTISGSGTTSAGECSWVTNFDGVKQ